MSLPVTFYCSIWGYMCNFSETYPAGFTRKHLKGRVKVTSVGWSSIILNWIFKTTTCLFWEGFVVVLLGVFFPPLLCLQFSDNLQTYSSEKNCSHGSSLCCHLVAGFSKLHNHVSQTISKMLAT